MTPAATIPRQRTGTIILDFLQTGELWCSPLGHRPKVLTAGYRFVLAAGPRFCALNTSIYNGLRAQCRRHGGPGCNDNEEGRLI
jgi:hypothetical protein